MSIVYPSYLFFATIIIKKPATVAQHVAHPLVVEKVIGSNLGSTPRHN